jgi:hypothetical protein
LISFRYHVVTLVAVFLALGVGVLFGVSFIDQSTVETLRNSQTRLGARNEVLRERVVALEKERDALNTYVASSRDQIVRGALRDRAVVMLSFDSTPVPSVEAVAGTIQLAGGALEGSVTLSDRLDLRSEDGRRRLATVLDAPSNGVEALSDLAVSRLVQAFSGRDDTAFLQKLADDGLASGRLPATGTGAETAAGQGRAVVIVGGNGSRELNDRLLLPLARSLAAVPMVTAVVESGSAPLRVLAPLREESGLRVVTVDGVDTPLGQAALAAGLRAGFEGQFGNYGVGAGATAALPAS